jgi:hypothetical protein
MEEPGRNADNAGNAGIAGIAENEKGSPPVERCLASSIVRLSRTMETGVRPTRSEPWRRRVALTDLSLG